MLTVIVGVHDVMCWNVTDQIRMFSITCAGKKKDWKKYIFYWKNKLCSGGEDIMIKPENVLSCLLSNLAVFSFNSIASP